MKIAILIGTSGLVGMQLLHQLLQNPVYDYVLSIGRRKLSLKHGKLIQISGDMNTINSWDLDSKLSDQDLGGENHGIRVAIKENTAAIHAFSALGTTIKQAGSKDNFIAVDHGMVLQFAHCAKKLGAKKFLNVSALSADANSKVFYNKVKGKLEEDLKGIGFEYVGIFRPSLLMGNRSPARLGEEFAKLVTKPFIWLKLFKKMRPIYDYQVAKSMVIKALEVNSPAVEIIESDAMQDLTK
jgi:uncharacterized protein YbjT (DUF2867 family)